MLTQQGSMQPIPATMPMTVTLEAQQWNIVMGALADAPYKVAAPLLDALQKQLESSLNQAAPSKLPNGEALPPPPQPVTEDASA